MTRRRVFEPTFVVLIRIIGTKVNKFGTIATTIVNINMSRMETTILIITTTGTTMATRMIELGLMFLQKIRNLAIGKLGVVCHILRI